MAWQSNPMASTNAPAETEMTMPTGRLRLTLLQEKQFMRSITLPEKIEGRYTFADEDDALQDLPLYIEAVQGHWAAGFDQKGRTWAFRKNGAAVSQTELHDCQLLDMSDGRERCLLYCEFVRKGDRALLPYYIQPHSEILIGRSPECDICYDNALLSRRHARIIHDGKEWMVSDENSTNGVWLNGQRITGKMILHPGDTLYILGLIIAMGVSYIGINSNGKNISFTTPRVRQVQSTSDIFYSPVPENPEGTVLYDRKPRRVAEKERKPMEIEMPPQRMGVERMPLITRIGSTLLSGGTSLLTGNVLSSLSELLMPLAANSYSEQDKKNYESRRQSFYKEYLEKCRKAIIREISEEQEELNEMYPPFAAALEFPFEQKRLWERRPVDPDFLKIRIGTGHIPMLAAPKFPEERLEMDADPLTGDMYAMKKENYTLPQAPVMLSLTEAPVTSVVGKRAQVLDLIRHLVLQIALTHSYDEVKMVLLAGGAEAALMDEMRYLPHFWDEERSIRFMADSKTDACRIGQYLMQHLDSEEKGDDSRKQQETRKEPAYIVIALNQALLECLEFAKAYIASEEYKGFSFVTAFDFPPKETRQLIEMDNHTGTLADLHKPRENDLTFTLEKVSESRLQQALKRINRTALMSGEGQFQLPRTYTFLEMFHAGRVEHLSPLTRWKESNPVQSLAAPVGVGTDGELFYLDLHQKHQGPHGLVAGMTGSGKSEWLITYILSMAVTYSPDEVAFVLIDYKGGGLANAFEDPERGIFLPHIAGTITNLDGAAVHRAMVSISSELKRRQRVFNKAKSDNDEGTMDIYDYQRLYRMGKVKEPMPHLIIISDEFAELRSQQPEFLDELISTARIGRSLGVHLILATQKPSGVVNDQIWSNSRFHICLKVQDRSDSMDMLHRPEAAELKETGRFYLQVGYNEYFAMGQSAWAGAMYQPRDEVEAEIDDAVEFIDNTGRVVVKNRPRHPRQNAEQKQIVAVVRYLSDLARREGIRTRRLWLDPLPDVIDWDTASPAFQQARRTEIFMGMLDDPERQEQYPYALDLSAVRHLLICGESSSGKSTMLHTLLYGLISSFSPEEAGFYLVDLSNGALSPFRSVAHCGGYLTETDEEGVRRLLLLLQDTVTKRRALFRQAGVTDYSVYVQQHVLPLILVVVDGMQNLSSFAGQEDIRSAMHALMRESAVFGINFILTANYLNDVWIRIQQEMDTRIALKMKDRYALMDLLNVRPESVQKDTPGRAMVLVDGRPLEMQTAMPVAAQTGGERLAAVALAAEGKSGQYMGKGSIAQIPVMDADQTYADFCATFAPGRIPLGYEANTLKRVAMPLKQLNSASLYFGTSRDTGTVWGNLLDAAQRNGMKVIILQRSGRSVFTGRSLPPDAALFPCTPEGINRFDEAILTDALAMNTWRDEYCRMHGIPETAPGRAALARHYIYEHSRPVMVMIERMADLLASIQDSTQEAEFTALFERNEGYNVHYFAGFYPDDSFTRMSLFRAYNQAQFTLLFGGKLDQQRLVTLPMGTRSSTVLPKGRFLMYYRDEFHILQMPCGGEEEPEEDQDDASII